MFTTIQHFRFFTAPGAAVLLLAALFILEERQFDSHSALLLALITAVAVAEMIPALALSFVFLALVLQSVGVFPTVLGSGVLSYAAIPLVIFFATLVWKGKQRWVPAASAVAFAAVTTFNWFQDTTWINFVFGTQIYGRASIWTLVYMLLIFGAFAAFYTAAWALGAAVTAASVSSRAQAKAEARLRETATELALEQERNRIARELHDVLAHSLTVIIAQAEGIRYVHRTEPESVEESAVVIAGSARTALRETRSLIEGFSSMDGAGANLAAPDRINELAARFTSSGMGVSVQSTGDPWTLSAVRQLVVYRLIQEGLTNAFKHGDRGCGAEVSMIWSGDGVELVIESALAIADFHNSPYAQHAEGRGIAGMHSRIEAAGGWLTTNRDETTFKVSGFLPSSTRFDGGHGQEPGTKTSGMLEGARP